MTGSRHPYVSSALSRRGLLAGITTLGAAALAGCGIDGNPLSSSTPAGSGGTPRGSAAVAPIVVGWSRTTASKLLAELWSQALVAQGIASSIAAVTGSRAGYLEALRDESVSVVPDYTGRLMLYLDKGASASTADEIEAALKPLVTERGLAVLKPSTAVDQDVYCVTARLSSETGIMSLVDLKKIAAKSILGGPSELADLPYGPPGLEAIYEATFAEFRPYDTAASKLDDLLVDTIQVATFLTTDPTIADNGLVQLADPETMILPQNIVPLVRPVIADNPEAVAAINAVQAAITTTELTAMIKKIDGPSIDAKRVAKAFLEGKSLS